MMVVALSETGTTTVLAPQSTALHLTAMENGGALPNLKRGRGGAACLGFRSLEDSEVEFYCCDSTSRQGRLVARLCRKVASIAAPRLIKCLLYAPGRQSTGFSGGAQKGQS